jgi:hypothetical protein
MTLTKGQIATTEELALAEYREHAGKLLEVDYLCGYDEHDDSVDAECRAIVRVDQNQQPHSGILHWNDEWLDQYWDVTVIRMLQPPTCGVSINGEKRGVRLNSTWIYGPSHNVLTGERDWKHVRPLSWGESLRARLRGILEGKR